MNRYMVLFILVLNLIIAAEATAKSWRPAQASMVTLDIARSFCSTTSIVISDTGGTNAVFEWGSTKGKYLLPVTRHGQSWTHHACFARDLGRTLLTNRVDQGRLWGDGWGFCPDLFRAGK